MGNEIPELRQDPARSRHKQRDLPTVKPGQERAVGPHGLEMLTSRQKRPSA